jgi:hypothetical protein
MAEDPIRKYSDAVKELEKVIGQVELLQGIMGRMYNYLGNPYKLMIFNVSAKFPTEVTLGRDTPTFDAKNWPQIQQIAEALADLHSKRKAAEEAWHNLSDTDKKLVKPLPEKK